MSVDPNIRAQVMEILSDPMSLPPEFWGYDVQNWMKEAPVFPISQVFGFSQFTATTGVVAASQSTTSSTYGNLATTGPTLSNLPDGKYLVLWGAFCKGQASVTEAIVGVSVNGAAAPGGDHANIAATNTSDFVSVVSFDTFSLSNNGSNTLQLKYASSDNVTSCSFANRVLSAFKYSNL